MAAESAVQAAIFTKLKAASAITNAVVDIYDAVPQLDEREEPDESFPYVVIGEDDATEEDTDDSLGFSILCEVHVWSRYDGRKEVKDLQGAIYTALHRQALTVTGYTFIDCQFEESHTFLEPDGRTRHGVQVFRIHITE